jgi:hypothetical protein
MNLKVVKYSLKNSKTLKYANILYAMNKIVILITLFQRIKLSTYLAYYMIDQ